MNTLYLIVIAYIYIAGIITATIFDKEDGLILKALAVMVGIAWLPVIGVAFVVHIFTKLFELYKRTGFIWK